MKKLSKVRCKTRRTGFHLAKLLVKILEELSHLNLHRMLQFPVAL